VSSCRWLSSSAVGSSTVGAIEIHRTAECVVELEDRVVDQREVDRGIRRDVRIAALEVLDVLHLLGAEHADRLRQVHFLTDVGEESVVP
jgi:hypothetical protein